MLFFTGYSAVFFCNPAAFSGMSCLHFGHHVAPSVNSVPQSGQATVPGQVTVLTGASTGSTSRPQCLQTLASFRICSAQWGHFRNVLSSGAGRPMSPTIKRPIGPRRSPPKNHPTALLPFEEAIAAAPMPHTIHNMMYPMFYSLLPSPHHRGPGKSTRGWAGNEIPVS